MRTQSGRFNHRPVALNKLFLRVTPKAALYLTIRWIQMRQLTLSPAEREANLAELDQMIAALERLREPNPLMEHLHSARVYLLGAMPDEYLLSIESAKQALDVVPDGNLRNAMDTRLSILIAEMYHQRD
jgi:hypothetical protein